MSNLSTFTGIGPNSVGVDELELADGTDGQVIKTDGSGTISFIDVPPAPTGELASFQIPLTSQGGVFADINWPSTNTQTYGWVIQRTTGVSSGVAQLALVQGGNRTIADGGCMATILPFQILANNTLSVGTAAVMWTNTGASVDFSTCSIVHDNICGLFSYSGNIPFPPATTHVMGYGAGCLNADNTASNFSHYGGTDRGIHQHNGQLRGVPFSNGLGFRGMNTGYRQTDSKQRIHQLEFVSPTSMTTNYQDPSANTSTSPVCSMLTQDNLDTTETAISGACHWRDSSDDVHTRIFNGSSTTYTDYNSSETWGSPYGSGNFFGIQLSNGKTVVFHGSATYLYTAHNSRTAITTAEAPPWTTNTAWYSAASVWVEDDTWVTLGSVSGNVAVLEKWEINPTTCVWTQVGSTHLMGVYGYGSYQHLHKLPNDRLAWILREGSGVCKVKIFDMPAFA